MIKEPDTDKTIYPEDNDWANYTTNLHDGWADDVNLVYKDDSWKPDDDELTFVDIEDNEESDEDVVESSNVSRARKHISRFGIFLIFWSIVLIATATILLTSYYDRLARYQLAFENSKPERALNELLALCDEHNYDALYGTITNPPELNEFENDISLKTIIANDLIDKKITFEETTASSDLLASENDLYYIMKSDSAVVGEIILRNSTAKTDEFGFTNWYLSSLNYEFHMQSDVRINAPSNVTVYINSIPVSDIYCYSEDQTEKSYIIGGFYGEPSINAKDSTDSPVDVFYNETDMIYTVK